PSYGMTETCGQVAAVCDPGAQWRAGRVGRPLPGMECAIVDPDDNGIGRIRLRGPQVMAGYAGDDGVRGGLDREGGFETGDLGHWDADAGLTVLGRADEVLVSGGVNVHPVPAESVLADCPGVEAVAVTGCADPVWGERLVALYVGTASTDEVERWCREHLSSAERPRTFRRVDSLPYGDGGKPDRAALRRFAAP
ncbi:MAG TPA: class I adenylate-forming enzyme family protein, partial [Gammaproteobacteria bacterium]|nr:class I adenylate-forming enzyme family protein [Gammaproteobacteria bacterium]